MHLGNQKGYLISHEHFFSYFFGTTRWAVHWLMSAFIFVWFLDFSYIYWYASYFHFTHTSCKAYRVCVYNPGAPIRWCRGYFRRCWVVEIEGRLQRHEVVRYPDCGEISWVVCVWEIVRIYLWVLRECVRIITFPLLCMDL